MFEHKQGVQCGQIRACKGLGSGRRRGLKKIRG